MEQEAPRGLWLRRARTPEPVPAPRRSKHFKIEVKKLRKQSTPAELPESVGTDVSPWAQNQLSHTARSEQDKNPRDRNCRGQVEEILPVRSREEERTQW